MTVITILEGHVAPENWEALEQSYRTGTERIPPQMTQSFLIHSITDPTLWKIISVWHSRKALEEMRSEGTPAGVLMFRAARAEPVLTIFDVAVQISAP